MTPRIAFLLYSTQILSYWALFALLCWRSAWRQQRALCAYVSYGALWNAAMLVADRLFVLSTDSWWALYRVDSVVTRALSLWVAVSLLWDVYYPALTLNRRLLTRWLFCVPGLALLGIAICPQPRLLAIDVVANWVVLGCFLIAVLPFLSHRVYIGSHCFGIGLGFLLLYLSGTVRSMLVSRVGQGDAAMMLSEIVVCGVWAWSFLRHDRPIRANGKTDTDNATENLRTLGRTGIHVMQYGAEVLVHWNTQGTGTTFCVRASQIPTKSSILAHEAVKLAEFEIHDRNNPGLRATA